MQPLAGQTEDIEAVLSRFQAWNGQKTGSRKSKDDREGVREISYEEALRSSRYRWKVRVDEQAVAESEAVSTFVVRPDAASEITPAAVSEVIPVAVSLPKPLVAEDTKPARSVRPQKITPTPADFRSMLTQTVSPGETSLVRSRAGEPERQVSMSLRLAASEQALVKLRAAEAGLSASAYLRQCALEVEHLRAQMQILLEISQSPRKAPSPQPPRFFEKLRGLFSRAKKRTDFVAENSSADWLHRRELAG
jgi:hypothetical protein